MLLMETAHLQRNKSRQIKALVIGYFTKAFSKRLRIYTLCNRKKL